MGVFNWWPYTNLHEMNLDLVLQELKKSIEQWMETEKNFGKLSNDFEDLKKYVANYFDGLDVTKEVSDKLEQMLADGELDDILQGMIMTWNLNWGSEISGSPIIRMRLNNHEIPSDDSSRTRSMQQGIIYSPTGSYENDGTTKYAYIWNTWNDELNTELVTVDLVNNQEIYRIEVPNAGHGGPLAIKENVLYCITNNYVNDTNIHYLMKFDITTPAAPVLISSELYNLAPTYLAGYDDISDSFIGIEHTTEARNIYHISDTFTNAELIATLEMNRPVVVQDYCVDNGILYSISTYPNAIQMNSIYDGSAIASSKIPDMLSYITITECEWISVHDDNLYFGSQNSAGCRQSSLIDMVGFYSKAESSRLYERHINTIAVSSSRAVTIDSNASPLNPTYGVVGGDNLKFKYIEDAFNYGREAGKVVINFNDAYPYSFHVNTDAIINLNGKDRGAIYIDDNVHCYMQGLGGNFIGEPMIFDAIKTFIYVQRAATLTLNNYDQLASNPAADVMIYGVHAIINIQGDAPIKDMYITGSQLISCGYISENFHSHWSLLDVKGVIYTNGATQYIDERSTLKAKMLSSRNNYRVSLNDIIGKKFPKQIMLDVATNSALSGKPLDEIYIFGSAVQTHTAQWGYWSSDTTWTNVVLHIEHTTEVDPLGGYTAHRWSLIDVDNNATFPSDIRTQRTIWK